MNKIIALVRIFKVLLEHFKYSINDINSYDELTAEEKSIIPRDIFNILNNSLKKN